MRDAASVGATNERAGKARAAAVASRLRHIPNGDRRNGQWTARASRERILDVADTNEVRDVFHVAII